MAGWPQLQTALAAALASLNPGGNLVVTKASPEVWMQFSVSPEGDQLHAEVTNGTADDDRLPGRGWELCDAWGGVWRRSTVWPATTEQVTETVTEAAFVVRGLWGNPRPEGFGYLAWEEPAPAPAWQFWKSAKEKPLTFPDLGLPKAPEPDPNS